MILFYADILMSRYISIDFFLKKMFIDCNFNLLKAVQK